MLILSKKRLSFIVLLLLATSGFSQPMEDEFGYFIFPIKPGVRNTLAGTMGELRSTHFHTGIDIRTGGQQGLSVLAAADGYISRIKVSGGGYGNTIYIMHPNGKTTVYAHLKSFRGDLEKYVKEAQYRHQSFEVNLFPKANQFVVATGDTIALSGNSGSSGGPHLHFDIRDENQNLLNPLKYGFTEVIDTRSPYAKSLAITGFDKKSRIEGEFGRYEFKIIPDGNNFVLADTIHALGLLGIELYAWDRMNGTRFKTGITEIEFTLDEKETFGQFINSWSFSKARSFYQHINYQSLVTSGKRYHKLYVANGNGLGFYKRVPGKGQFLIVKDKYYHGKILLSDSYGNTSYVRFVILGDDTGNASGEPVYSQNIISNTLKIVGDSTADQTAVVNVRDDLSMLSSAYINNQGNPVFLWDLTTSIPEAIGLADTTLYPDLVGMVPPKQEYKVFNKHADVIFNKNSLFDTLMFNLSFALDTALNLEKLAIGNPEIPIKGSVTTIIKPENKALNMVHTAVYQVFGKNNYSFVGGKWKGDQIELKIRSFGVYTVIEDSVPPTIKPLIINRERIVFKLDDKLSGLKKITASINGQWLLIAKDPKKKQYWAEKRNATDNYVGELVLEVTDNANNTKVYRSKIK
jgi:peptidase M23-like protein